MKDLEQNLLNWNKDFELTWKCKHEFEYLIFFIMLHKLFCTVGSIAVQAMTLMVKNSWTMKLLVKYYPAINQ